LVEVAHDGEGEVLDFAGVEPDPEADRDGRGDDGEGRQGLLPRYRHQQWQDQVEVGLDGDRPTAVGQHGQQPAPGHVLDFTPPVQGACEVLVENRQHHDHGQEGQQAHGPVPEKVAIVYLLAVQQLGEEVA
jgi:hypothetical protein